MRGTAKEDSTVIWLINYCFIDHSLLKFINSFRASVSVPVFNRSPVLVLMKAMVNFSIKH